MADTSYQKRKKEITMQYHDNDLIDMLHELEDCEALTDRYEKAFVSNLLLQEDEQGHIVFTDKQRDVIVNLKERYLP